MAAETVISLTEEQDAYVRALVECGRYSSVSAVFQQGLELLRRDDATHALKIQALQELIDQRRAGTFVPLGDSDLIAEVNRED